MYIEMERNASENEYCVMHYDQLPPPRPVTPSEEQAQKGALVESNYLPLVPGNACSLEFLFRFLVYVLILFNFVLI